jgi:hypothetical protein
MKGGYAGLSTHTSLVPRINVCTLNDGRRVIPRHVCRVKGEYRNGFSQNVLLLLKLLASNRRTLRRNLLVTANVVPSIPILSP